MELGLTSRLKHEPNPALVERRTFVLSSACGTKAGKHCSRDAKN